MSLRKKILDFVLSRSETTVTEVVAALGKEISASQAASYGRSLLKSRRALNSRCDVVESGKKFCIAIHLSALERQGKLRRVRYRTYAPPDLKLYQSEEKPCA